MQHRKFHKIGNIILFLVLFYTVLFIVLFYIAKQYIFMGTHVCKYILPRRKNIILEKNISRKGNAIEFV